MLRAHDYLLTLDMMATIVPSPESMALIYNWGGGANFRVYIFGCTQYEGFPPTAHVRCMEDNNFNKDNFKYSIIKYYSDAGHVEERQIEGITEI
jgi:hypothetical protein